MRVDAGSLNNTSHLPVLFYKKEEAGKRTAGGPAAAPNKAEKVSELTERMLKRLGLKDCKTCKERKYQDVSSDPGVSFKTPTHISPAMSGVAVAGHENEHVVRERAKAEREGKEVIYQTVQIFTSVCPECGRVYVSGGKTVTITRDSPLRKKSSGTLLDCYF